MVITDDSDDGVVATLDRVDSQLTDPVERALDIRLGRKHTGDLGESLGELLFSRRRRHT